MQNIKVKKVAAEEDLQKVFAIRQQVFVVEQHCPPELEWSDEEVSIHFLATCNGIPCGAARWRQTVNGFKLERFAVLEAFRGMGVGSELLKTVLSDLPPEASAIYLNAQLSAIGFYERFGFSPTGELFEEAGITHRQMVLPA